MSKLGVLKGGLWKQIPSPNPKYDPKQNPGGMRSIRSVHESRSTNKQVVSISKNGYIIVESTQMGIPVQVKKEGSFKNVPSGYST